MFTQNTYSILIVHQVLLILLLLFISLFSTANALVQDSSFQPGLIQQLNSLRLSSVLLVVPPLFIYRKTVITIL